MKIELNVWLDISRCSPVIWLVTINYASQECNWLTKTQNYRYNQYKDTVLHLENFGFWCRNHAAIGWHYSSLKLQWVLEDLFSTCSLPLEIGGSLCFNTYEMNRPVCLEVHNYLLAHLWQLIFYHICGIKYRLGCKYTSENIFNENNFKPHIIP